MAEPSYEELKARVAELEKTQGRKRGSLEFKVSEKGGMSVYGLGRFPVTLYYEQWIRLLDQTDQLREFLEANKGGMQLKDTERRLQDIGVAPVRKAHRGYDRGACIIFSSAPVAQLDRAIASGAIGREFESLRARQSSSSPSVSCGCFDRPPIPALCSLCPILCPPSFDIAESTASSEG